MWRHEEKKEEKTMVAMIEVAQPSQKS